MAGKYSSFIKPHATGCDGHCDSCWALALFYVLESGQPLCIEERWERDVSEFVDRTPGFVELMAEHPRAMFQAISDEMKDFHDGHQACLFAAEYLKGITCHFYLCVTAGHLLVLPKNRVWRNKFMATRKVSRSYARILFLSSWHSSKTGKSPWTQCCRTVLTKTQLLRINNKRCSLIID